MVAENTNQLDFFMIYGKKTKQTNTNRTVTQKSPETNAHLMFEMKREQPLQSASQFWPKSVSIYQRDGEVIGEDGGSGDGGSGVGKGKQAKNKLHLCVRKAPTKTTHF